MAWEIKVWHEDLGGTARLVIEASPQIPDDVISSVAGSYWFEEVQVQEDWLGDEYEIEPGQRLQG